VVWNNDDDGTIAGGLTVIAGGDVSSGDMAGGLTGMFDGVSSMFGWSGVMAGSVAVTAGGEVISGVMAGSVVDKA